MVLLDALLDNPFLASMLASPPNGIGSRASGLVEANGNTTDDNQPATISHIQMRDADGKDKKKKEDWAGVLVGKQDKGSPETGLGSSELIFLILSQCILYCMQSLILLDCPHVESLWRILLLLIFSFWGMGGFMKGSCLLPSDHHRCVRNQLKSTTPCIWEHVVAYFCFNLL